MWKSGRTYSHAGQATFRRHPIYKCYCLFLACSFIADSVLAGFVTYASPERIETEDLDGEHLPWYAYACFSQWTRVLLGGLVRVKICVEIWQHLSQIDHDNYDWKSIKGKPVKVNIVLQCLATLIGVASDILSMWYVSYHIHSRWPWQQPLRTGLIVNSFCSAIALCCFTWVAMMEVVEVKRQDDAESGRSNLKTK